MTHPTPGLRLGAIALAIGASALGSAHAQTAPAASTTPLRIVVPFPAGTALDVLARDLSNRLPPVLGRPVIVDNRTGAGGNIGTEHVAHAAPDGATVLLTAHANITINPLIYNKLNFDPLKDLIPLASLSQGGYLLGARPDTPYRTVADLVAAAKKKPDGLTYGSYGYGTMAHICMEQFQQATGTKLQHVPYRGPMAPDLMAGHVDVAFENLAPSVQLVNTQKMAAIAVTHTRVTPLPNVPALSEAVPNFQCVSWVGVFAPKGTAPAVQKQLAEEITKIVRSPAYTQMTDMLGGVPAPMDQKTFTAFVNADADKWRKLIPPLNIKLD